jgi:hypothetical protein
MALQEKHRTRYYAHLVEQVGEETADAVLGQFPARELDEPATKDFVALQIAELRTELHQEIGALRTELHQQTEKVIHRLQVEGAIAVIVLAAVNAIVG